LIIVTQISKRLESGTKKVKVPDNVPPKLIIVWFFSRMFHPDAQ